MTRTSWTVATTLTALALAAGSPAIGQTSPPAGATGTSPSTPARGRLGGLFNRAKTDPNVQPARAQDGGAMPSTPAASLPSEPATPNGALQTFKSGAAIPEPVDPEQLQAPTIALPTGPMEPFLLTRQNGPFMVLAHTFRGPDAARYAQALAMELRDEHALPAYVFFNRIQPGHSNIRNVPPTAPAHIQSSESMSAPESYRSYDEAAVLVGDCKTIDDSEKVLHQVKKIRSRTIDGVPTVFEWRKKKGLSRATLTTNPLVPSQELFPEQERVAIPVRNGAPGDTLAAAGAPIDPSVATAAMTDNNTPTNIHYFGPSTVVIQSQGIAKVVDDPLVKRMNSGPDSLLKCPGAMVLEVASFAGRASVDMKDKSLADDNFLRKGPLAQSADQATTLAANLRRCKKLPAGVEVYVFHDRTASRVFIGPFQSTQDARLHALVDRNNRPQSVLDEVSQELLTRNLTSLPLAPSDQLTPVPH
jgi:hypothetical protein